MKTIEKNGVYFKFLETENGLFLHSVSTNRSEPTNGTSFLPFIVCPLGQSAGSTFGAFSTAFKNRLGDFRQTGWFETNDELKIVYESDMFSCRVETVYAFVRGAKAVYQKNILTALADIVLTDFYSVVPIVEYETEENDEYTLSYRRNRWQTEGQWYTNTLSDLGFNAFCKHVPMNRFSIFNMGSQTTSEYFPSVVLRNKKTNEYWFLENEADSHWFIELSEYHSWEQKSGQLLLLGGGIEERCLQSRFALAAGETVETPKSLLVVANSEQDMMSSVYQAKRSVSKYNIDSPLVVYNDFMNGLWANPKYEAEKSLIDACSEIGVDCFVIDDGWFNYKDEIYCRFGDWNIDGEMFGELGLPGIIDYIREKKMIAGLWCELEVFGENSQVFQQHPEWTITAGAKSYGSMSRHFVDFRKKEAREYLYNTIRKLYNLGVRYIKTDYNDSYFFADSIKGANNGLRENYQFIVAFYQQIKSDFPDLRLECCASGGKRSDAYILQCFDVQSVSDQEEYLNYPSIICGSLINTLPEKLGVWSMPWPVRYHQKELPIDDVLPPKREEIVFNLVNGLTGVVTLGSMIDRLNADEKELVAEAIALYPRLYGLLKEGYPTFPIGLTRIEDLQHALCFHGENEDLLYLWSTGKREFQLQESENYKQIFPKEEDSLITKGTITLKEEYCARIFIKKK